MNLKKLKIIDLFCGCGGFSAGVINAALKNEFKPEISLALDFDSEALNVYNANFKRYTRKLLNLDIINLFPEKPNAPYTANEKKIKKELNKIDILVAGPPCQGHSDLNNKTRRDDPRNQLYLKVIRAIEVIKPKIIIIENVASVIHDKSQVVQESINFLKKLEYRVETVEIKANEYGIAQKRKRHLLLAVKFNMPHSIEKELSMRKKNSIVLKDIINDIVDECQTKQGIFYTPSLMNKDNKKRVNFLFDNELYNLPNKYRPNCHMNNKHSYVSMYGRMKWTEPAQTITSGFGSMGQGRFVHPLRKRVITPHEAARIQGFSDDFIFTCAKKRTYLHKMIGNAVPPPIAETVTSIVLKYL
ncbi:MAG: DNA cytosine methyltransferase [Deltaproteobacteria bacterium]|nr:DNA cytosine methyltransferase [Deltaproteobacteria bacterium]MBW1834313.1 DNA cytosine methyltransferase [Deltaproteobacteria bacterium]MBW2166110.1 DNA cytosine methyltransferase [Deltaproteobacteria bacterium]